MNQQTDSIFVIECCQDCGTHGWNTRHDEAKYQDYFQRVAAAIIERIPTAVVMKNQIPKAYLNFDIYNNLIPNEDPTLPHYQQVPRTGAFEVSYKGLLIFSKINGKYWPNPDLVGDKCEAVRERELNGMDCSDFLAGKTPLKTGGAVQSSRKKTRSPGR